MRSTLHIYNICDVMMSILVNETGSIFECIFWTKVHQVSTNLSQLTDISKGNNLQESFEQFEGLGLSSIATYVRILVFHFFWKGQYRTTKKMSTTKNGQILLYCCFNKIIKGPGISFQYASLTQSHDCHTAYIWPTFVL